ncbi:peptidyl-tRNA hydrolase [Bacteroidia bacterium]|nr:peptidyl-tRNA hydrolase [Bacteroidia bacterium]
MKYLIVGLGNIGDEYKNTRHNIGFKILDTFAEVSNIVFAEQRYGSVAECRLKGQTLIFLKPSTFMNLSGNALRYWLQKENIALENLLVLVDDLALPFGTLRLKGNGSDAGHNGLKNIQEILGHNNYARLRFGIGSNFSRGRQIDYVLGEWTGEECEKLPERIDVAVEMVKTFCLAGIQTAMNLYNNK